MLFRSSLIFNSTTGGSASQFWIGRGGVTGSGTLAFYAPTNYGLEFGLANGCKFYLDTSGNINMMSGVKILNSSGRQILGQSGSILQVQSARTGQYFTSSSTGWTDITGLSVNITPTSTSSKIYLMLSFGRATTQAYNLDMCCGIRVLANGADTLNINGDSDGSRPKIAMNTQGTAFNADHSQGGFTVSSLESPGTTSTITYKAQVLCQAAANPFIMNGVPNNGNTGNIYHSRGSSSITAWEIAQ